MDGNTTRDYLMTEDLNDSANDRAETEGINNIESD
jgi:hypothetical protein